MSRLSSTFERLRAERRAGLVTYVTAGDPDLETSADILRALDGAGADVLEVGVPFSDPVADGPVIQRAVERALAAGGSLSATLDLVAGLRTPVARADRALHLCEPGIPARRRALRRAGGGGWRGRRAGARPAARGGRGRAPCPRRAGLDMIFLLSPTTSDARLAEASRLGSGFLYAISRLGVTGARDAIADRRRGPRPAHQGPQHLARGAGLRHLAARSTCGRWRGGRTRRWWAAASSR